MNKVWILLSTGVLNIPDPHPGEDTVQTRTFAYATREAACDALREFMRPDVNESRPEEAWNDDFCYTVDAALDFILDENDDLKSDGDGFWTWDGSIRSYEWKLIQLEVKS